MFILGVLRHPYSNRNNIFLKHIFFNHFGFQKARFREPLGVHIFGIVIAAFEHFLKSRGGGRSEEKQSFLNDTSQHQAFFSITTSDWNGADLVPQT